MPWQNDPNGNELSRAHQPMSNAQQLQVAEHNQHCQHPPTQPGNNDNLLVVTKNKAVAAPGYWTQDVSLGQNPDAPALTTEYFSASVNDTDLARHQATVQAAARMESELRTGCRLGVQEGVNVPNLSTYGPNSIMSMLLRDPAFKLFSDLAIKAKVDFDLGSADSSLTVFCPTSHAIMKVLSEKGQNVMDLYNSPNISQIVKNHIVMGPCHSKDLADGKHVQMWGGNFFMVRRQGGINKIQDAPIQGLNIKASNGLVHVIGGMLGNIVC
mmetsp:Transcript_482/g.856  ORF Transcript_482/g.856 Transcript_482/m.856 type:complete len:269 (+) Transcript_482:3-809(+)